MDKSRLATTYIAAEGVLAAARDTGHALGLPWLASRSMKWLIELEAAYRDVLTNADLAPQFEVMIFEINAWTRNVASYLSNSFQNEEKA